MFPVRSKTTAVSVCGHIIAGLILAVALGGGSVAHGQADSLIIDACHYTDDAQAQAAWQPMSGSPPALAGTVEGVKAVRMRCPFAGKAIERASWDRSVRIDLSACRGLRFQFLCRDVGPVSGFSLYLQSGEGWYATTFYPEAPGWNTITIDKAGMRIEGRPAGWGAVRTIRVSAWRGGETDTEFALSDIRKVGQLGGDTLVALLRCDSAAQGRGEEVRSVEQFCSAVAGMLEKVGVGYATLSDVNLNPDTLRLARLVILPHNPTMPDRTLDELIRYVQSGGRVLTFYGMPARLRPVVKIDTAGYVRPKTSGEFSAMRFVAALCPARRRWSGRIRGTSTSRSRSPAPAVWSPSGSMRRANRPVTRRSWPRPRASRSRTCCWETTPSTSAGCCWRWSVILCPRSGNKSLRKG